MGKYILKRVLQFIPVFIGVTIILFAMKTIVPGDPISMITGGRSVPEQTRLQLEVENNMIYGDENGRPIYDENGDTIPVPIWEQYIRYMDDLLHGDLGTSYQKKRPVTDIFAEKYPYTIKLAVCAICLEAVMGIGAGLVSAIKRYSFWDILVTLITSVLVAVPAFWLGMILQLTFGIWLKDLTGGAISLPISGAGGPNSQYMDWVHYILPAFTLAAVSTAYTARIMRSQLLDVMNQDYIRTARAKGLPEWAVVWKHGFRTALLPVVTTILNHIPHIIGGSLVVERIFGWPGMGSLLFTSVSSRDYTVIMGLTVVIALTVLATGILMDLVYRLVDPGVGWGGEGR